MSSQDQSAQDMRHTPSSAGHYVPRQASGYEEVGERPRPRGLVLSFTLLAAVLMILTGVMGFFEGLTAGLNGHFYVVRANYPLAWSVHGWGRVHLIIGVVLFAAGFALLMDKTWARVWVGTPGPGRCGKRFQRVSFSARP